MSLQLFIDVSVINSCLENCLERCLSRLFTWEHCKALLQNKSQLIEINYHKIITNQKGYWESARLTVRTYKNNDSFK